MSVKSRKCLILNTLEGAAGGGNNFHGNTQFQPRLGDADIQSSSTSSLDAKGALGQWLGRGGRLVFGQSYRFDGDIRTKVAADQDDGYMRALLFSLLLLRSSSSNM